METSTENILFIFTDQWKADCTGYRGHDVIKTPHLDELYKKSTDFTNSFDKKSEIHFTDC